MEREHDEHAAKLERLRELASNFVAPPEACTSWRALFLRCEQLEEDIMAHVHLENHVLFPRALNGDH
jgi:regulator of cell morphogenesis and NO signaling